MNLTINHPESYWIMGYITALYPSMKDNPPEMLGERVFDLVSRRDMMIAYEEEFNTFTTDLPGDMIFIDGKCPICEPHADSQNIKVCGHCQRILTKTL